VKKILVITMVIAVGCAGIAMAMKRPEKGKCPMMAKEGMESCCPMHHGMIKAMMERSLVATTDGGVVLLHGKTLVKYDKDLNMQKEVEIKCDPAAMKKAMEEMRASCPMCKKMGEKGGKGWQKEHEGHEM